MAAIGHESALAVNDCNWDGHRDGYGENDAVEGYRRVYHRGCLHVRNALAGGATGSSDTGNALIPLGFLAAVSMDCVIDGVVIGTGFAIGARKRVLVWAALALEMFILGLATEIAMRSGGARPTTVVATCVGLAAVLVASALIGFTLLVGAPAVLATLLAFGSAALLYFVTEELLVRAHDLGGTRLVTSLFFLGFVAVFSAELFS